MTITLHKTTPLVCLSPLSLSLKLSVSVSVAPVLRPVGTRFQSSAPAGWHSVSELRREAL